MDFEFSPEQLAFLAEVEAFLDEHDDPEVFDVTRENMAQIVDTPKRRAFMKELGHKGWLGITWPAEYGGSEGEGVYEYLLNEALAGRGGPQIGKGVGIIGKTLIAHGSDFLKETFLPMILENDVEFAVGYSEPNAGSDAASMKLKAERHTQDGQTGWLLNGQKTWTTSAHFAEWYWLGTRTDPDNKHHGITLMLVPLDHPNIEIRGIWTMGDERTNEVFIDNVFVPDEYVVGEVNQRLPVHQPGPRPRALHDVHVLADQAAPRPADRLRQDRDARRHPAQGRPRGAGPARPAAHRRRGGPGDGPQGRRRIGQGRAHDQGHRPARGSADGRVVRVQAVRHRVLAAAGQRVDGHRPVRAASCGCTPRTHPCRAAPSRPTATR